MKIHNHFCAIFYLTFLVNLTEWIKCATTLENWDLSVTVGGPGNLYSSSGGAAFQRFYAQRGTPAHIADANSQGFIFQRTGSDACTPSDASYNTGIIEG